MQVIRGLVRVDNYTIVVEHDLAVSSLGVVALTKVDSAE